MQQHVADEAPWAMVWFAGIIVVFDALAYLSGTTASLPYYVSDVAQGIGWVAGAFAIWRGLVPSSGAPWVFVSAVVLSSSMISYQFWLYPESNAIGVVLIMLTAFGAITLLRGPFVVAAALSTASATIAIVAVDPELLQSWGLGALTALLVSTALMWARRRSAYALALATLTIEDMARRDPLTGLLNRRGLLESVEPIAALARRDGRPLYAAFLDVVGLKAINDVHGHETGDAVIARAAQAVDATSRAGDLVCRWGGDEIVVVGTGTAPAAEDLAARLRVAVEPLEGIWDGGFWVGTASFPEADVAHLVDAADAEMYARRGLPRTAGPSTT